METLNCAYCGRPCFEGAILSAYPTKESETKWITMCHECFSLTNICALCKEARSCEFMTNPDPSPKQIQQTIRQGQAIIQTVVMNPERIEKTCKTLCKCWSDEFGCLKQNGICSQYEEVIPDETLLYN